MLKDFPRIMSPCLECGTNTGNPDQLHRACETKRGEPIPRSKPKFYPCLDCECHIVTDPRELLCPSCQERGAEAQRAHQLRECAPELLAELKRYHASAENALAMGRANGRLEPELLASGRRNLDATAALIARAESRNGGEVSHGC